MFNATQQGGLDLTLAPAVYLRDFAPKMDIVELPFLFRNYPDVDRIFRKGSDIGPQLTAELPRGNLQGLAFWEIGFRHVSTSRRPIRGPWDLKGLKIRTYSNQALIQAFRLLGADPVSMPYGELFTALQRGVIDGQEGPIDTFYRSKLYETQRFIGLTRHTYSVLVLVMNLKNFESLPRQEQEYVMNAAQDAADYGRDLTRNMEEKHIRELKERSVQIENNPDWDGFRREIFYEVQGKFVREDGRKLLREIERYLR